jgi:hypothetical protein
MIFEGVKQAVERISSEDDVYALKFPSDAEKKKKEKGTLDQVDLEDFYQDALIIGKFWAFLVALKIVDGTNSVDEIADFITMFASSISKKEKEEFGITDSLPDGSLVDEDEEDEEEEVEEDEEEEVEEDEDEDDEEEEVEEDEDEEEVEEDDEDEEDEDEDEEDEDDDEDEDDEDDE